MRWLALAVVALGLSVHGEQGEVAPPRVQVDVTAGGAMLLVKITDNGCGFDIGQVLDKGHFGLSGMRDRVDLIGGTLTLISRPGEGTTVAIEAPTR